MRVQRTFLGIMRPLQNSWVEAAEKPTFAGG